MNKLKPCPFCGGKPTLSFTSGSDERYGYNFSAVIRCCVELRVGTLQDKNGWCAEGQESVGERAAVKWNTRV